MSKERDEFIAIVVRELPNTVGYYEAVTLARRIMRYAATLHRIQELQCSSEAADRDRVPCPDRGKDVARCLCKDYGAGEVDGWGGHGMVPRINVQEAHKQASLDKVLAKYGWSAIYQGDPRGAVVKLKVPSGYTNDWGKEGVCVPTK